MAPGLVARVVIVCAVFWTAQPAAAERRKVAVVDLSATDPAKQLAVQVYQTLLDHADLQPLENPTLSAALQGPFEDEDAPRIERAKLHKKEAEDYLAQLDDAAAERAARAGMLDLALVLPTSQVLGLYAELAFAYGQAQIGLRKPNDASLAFQLAHRLDPGRRPDPMRYQPNIVQAYYAAANKPAMPAKLEIKGDGRVWIDGVERGPVGTYDVPEGLHLVQLSGPERETRGKQVLVPQITVAEIEAAPATTELKVRRARLALARARDAAERASAMKRLAELLGVGDAVLIVKGEGDKLRVQTWRDREPGFTGFVDGDKAPLDLLSPLAPPRKKPPPTEEPIVIEPPPIVVEKRWYQKNWVRASIAGGVVAGVVSAILYARRDRMLGAIDPDIKPKE